MDTLRVRLLGGFRVCVGDREVGADAWRRRKAAALVKALALAPGHRLHRERLADRLWPDLDADAAANQLHQTLRWARLAIVTALPPAGAEGARELAAPYLGLRGAELVLGPAAPVVVDLDEFERAARRALDRRDPGACRAAVERYTGELLPEDPYEEWWAEDRERARRLYVELLAVQAELHAKRGESADAARALERLLEADAANEDAHVALMRLHSEAGRRHDALRQFRRLGEVLQRDLDVEPGKAARQLYQEIVAQAPAAGESPPPAARPAPPAVPSAPAARATPPTASEPSASEPSAPTPTNLPASVNRFVGRREELARIESWLGERRLVTLSGAGGVGKTRVAVEAARRRSVAYPDGVWLVEFAPIADAALVSHAVAGVLGTYAEAGRTILDRVVDQLRDRTVLLLFDNCEHLIDACAVVASTLLGGCPGVTILATSREPLRIAGEQVFQVPPLALPASAPSRRADGDGGAGRAEAPEPDAVRLFVDRAVAAQPGFRLTASNRATVARVCRRLDGIPLALELAAARVAVESVESIAEGLDDRFATLTRGSRTALPRQRTLRASLDWSYQWLSDPERRLFRRLAVFAGGFDAEGVQAVANDLGGSKTHVRELLAGLVDKSLVVADIGRSETRYHLLETVRQYAWLLLDEHGELEAARDRHCAYCAALANHALPAINAGGQRVWLRRLDLERDNFRAAIEWARLRALVAAEVDDSAAARADVAIGLAAAHFRYWDVRSSYEEAWQRFSDVAELPGTAPSRALVTALAAYMARQRGDLTTALAQLDRAVTILEAVDRDSPLRVTREFAAAEARVKMVAAVVASDRGQVERSGALAREGLAIAERLGDEYGMSVLRTWVGIHAMHAADPDAAIQHFEHVVAMRRRIGDEIGLTLALLLLARVEVSKGLVARSRAHVEEAYAVARALGFRMTVAEAMWNLGHLAILQRDMAAAARYLDGSVSMFAESHHLRFLVRSFYSIALLAHLAAMPVEAARLFGSAAAVAPDHVGVMIPSERPLVDDALVALRERLGPERFAAESAIGAAWPLERARAESRQIVARVLAPAGEAGAKVTPISANPAHRLSG